jgi:hypothetical protein
MDRWDRTILPYRQAAQAIPSQCRRLRRRGRVATQWARESMTTQTKMVRLVQDDESVYTERPSGTKYPMITWAIPSTTHNRVVAGSERAGITYAFLRPSAIRARNKFGFFTSLKKYALCNFIPLPDIKFAGGAFKMSLGIRKLALWGEKSSRASVVMEFCGDQHAQRCLLARDFSSL